MSTDVETGTKPSKINKADTTASPDNNAATVVWHSWIATGWIGAAGVLEDAAMDLDDGEHVLLTLGKAAIGTLIGSACVDVDQDEQRRLIFEAGAFGTVTGLTAGAWAWCADKAELFENLWQPSMWGGFALGGVAFGAFYAALRARVRRARDPKSPTAAKLRRMELGGDYEQIFYDAGYGMVQILDLESGFGGSSERVLIELDQERNDTARSVKSAEGKIMGIAARILKERRGISIPNDAVTVSEVQGDAKRVYLDVTLRDVLTKSFSSADGEDITTPVLDPNQPLQLGFYQHGGPIEQPESGPHGAAIGASGSGKTTYFRAQIVQYIRRPHVALMAAGLSKFSSFLRPFFKPVVDGQVSRSPFCMVGGGDSGSENETDSALAVLMAAYMLYRHRMANRDLPRDDGGNMIPSRQHPRVISYFDEIDSLVKAKKDGTHHLTVTLPNGEKVTVPHMLTTVGSKGRSEGVELEIGSQRTTDSHLGFNSNDLFANINRRAVFYTKSRYDAKALTGDAVDPTKIPANTFRMSLGPTREMVPGKVIYYTSDDIALAMQAAEVNGSLGDLSGEEAAALGELWSGRWSASRFGHIADYVGLSVAGGATSGRRESGSGDQRGPVERSGGRSNRLDAAIKRAYEEAEVEQPETRSFGEELSSDAVQSVIDGMEQMLKSVSRDADPAEILRRALEIIGDREGAEPMKILAYLGWITPTTGKAEYDKAASELREALRAATGNSLLRTVQRRVNGEVRRIFLRSELDKGAAG